MASTHRLSPGRRRDHRKEHEDGGGAETCVPDERPRGLPAEQPQKPTTTSPERSSERPPLRVARRPSAAPESAATRGVSTARIRPKTAARPDQLDIVMIERTGENCLSPERPARRRSRRPPASRRRPSRDRSRLRGDDQHHEDGEQAGRPEGDGDSALASPRIGESSAMGPPAQRRPRPVHRRAVRRVERCSMVSNHPGLKGRGHHGRMALSGSANSEPVQLRRSR